MASNIFLKRFIDMTKWNIVCKAFLCEKYAVIWHSKVCSSHCLFSKSANYYSVAAGRFVNVFLHNGKTTTFEAVSAQKFNRPISPFYALVCNFLSPFSTFFFTHCVQHCFSSKNVSKMSISQFHSEKKNMLGKNFAHTSCTQTHEAGERESVHKLPPKKVN